VIKSFRLRLALLSALIAGLALLGFGAGSFWLIRSSMLARVDSEIRSAGERELFRRHAAEAWPGIELRLATDMGLRDSRTLVLLVEDASGQRVYRSPHWPAAWESASLVWPTLPESPAAPREGRTGALATRIAGWLLPAAAAAEPAMESPFDAERLWAQAGPRPGGGPGGNGFGAGPAPLGGSPGLPGGTPYGQQPPGPGYGPQGVPTGTPQGGLAGAPQGGPQGGLTGAPQAAPPGGGAYLPPSPTLPTPAPYMTPLPAPSQAPLPSAPSATPEPWRQLSGNDTAPSLPALGSRSQPLLAPHLPSDGGTPATGLPASPPAAAPTRSPVELPAEPIQATPNLPPQVSSSLRLIEIDGRDWHVGLSVTNDARIAVAVDPRFIDDNLRDVRNAYFAAVPLTLLLIAGTGWSFSGRALRPLRQLSTAARSVTMASMSQRLDSQGSDQEFGELIQVFNLMLARLERSFHQAQRFSADAAHELKTPLAILQGQLERAIATADEHPLLQIELSTILDEVRRLSTISRKLLLLSQADAGRMNLFKEPLDLSALVQDLAEDSRMLASGLRLDFAVQPGLRMQGDPGLLRQLLHNLVSNAVKYNVADGWLRITAHGPSNADGLLAVRVANASMGIPPADRERIFERFYRADVARNRRIEGIGLGLSLSREIARAHGGELRLDPPRPGEVSFSLTLPGRQTLSAAPSTTALTR
jgi:signal transduction histidine kinase